MNLNHLDLKEDALDFIIEEAKTDVWILTVDDNQFYIYKQGTFVAANLDFQTAVTLMHPEDAGSYIQIYNDILTGTRNKDRGTFRMKGSDGKYRHYRIRFMRHTDPLGKMDYMLCTQRDVTDQVEQTERQTELIDQFTNIFNHLPYAFLTFDDSGKVLNANALAVSLSKSSFNCDIYDVNITGYPVYNDEQREAFRQHKPFSCTYNHQVDGDDSMPFCEENISHFFIGRITYIPILDSENQFIVNLLLVKDITQEVLRDRENARFQKKLHILDRHFRLTRVLLNPHTGIIRQLVNQADGSILSVKHTVEEAMRWVHPQDKARLAEIARKTVCLADETLEADFRILRPGAQDYQPVSLVLIPDHGPANEVISYSGKARDMTEEMRRRQKLEDRIKQIKVLNDKYQISMWEYDIEKNLLISDNDGADNNRYHDFTLEDCLRTLHPDDVETVKQYVEEMKNHTYKMEPCVLRHRFGKDMPYVYFRYIPACVRNDNGEIKRYIFICRNITREREQLNELTRYATHTHQINKSCGITLWKYSPQTRVFHNIDPYLSEYEPDMTAEQLLGFTTPTTRKR